MRIAEFSHSVILSEADSRMFSEQRLGDARYTAPEYIPTGGRTGAPKPTKEGDVYSYGCIAILVRYAAHQPLIHFTLLLSRYCRERCRTGGFRKRVKYFQKKKGAHGLLVPLWRYDLAEFLLSRPQKSFDSKIDEVHLNLVQQCLLAEKSRPLIGKVLYLVLVQSSG